LLDIPWLFPLLSAHCKLIYGDPSVPPAAPYDGWDIQTLKSLSALEQ
jgi:hypothetical protein